MCGICGYISRKKIAYETLLSATNEMRRRGPDGYGIWQEEVCGRYVGLGHRRLSIFDLSQNGSQPMISDDGNDVIVYNGEVYNFKEIKKELESKGYVFKSNCDTEVILNAYREWDVKSFDRFNGMFAFSVLNRDKGKMILCRDRLGVKPLYYYRTDSCFYFASDLAAIMQLPNISRELDYEALHYYLWNMCIPAPKTIYKNVYKLEPGNYLEIDVKTNNVKNISWWSPYDIFKKGNIELSEEEWLEHTHDILADAVDIRMEADVPVGVFLSGGIDSSLVTAFAAESGREVETFSIGFNEEQYNEAQYAKEIANCFSTNHHTMYCSIDDAKELIQSIPKVYSEPFADNSQIPMLLLSKMTRESVTVALSGDGGDELFGGYPNVLGANRIFRARFACKIGGAIATQIMRSNSHLYSYNSWRIRKLANAGSKSEIRNLDYLTANELINSILKFHQNSSSIITDNETNLPEANFINQMLLRDMRIGLPDDMLTKVDRATMFYSLESRSPLLDYRLAEDAIRMPVSVKHKDGELKHVLKSLLKQKVSDEIINRPKKGFGIPINEWLRDNKFIQTFEKYFESEWINKQNIFDANGVRNLYSVFKENPTPILGRLIWTYVNFQMWWKEYN